MARIPETELEHLKAGVSLERLAEVGGVELKRHGADLLGLCPFHADHEPSLVISPSKNLWHCLGARQAGGSVIDCVGQPPAVPAFHQAGDGDSGDTLNRPDLPGCVAAGDTVNEVRKLMHEAIPLRTPNRIRDFSPFSWPCIGVDVPICRDHYSCHLSCLCTRCLRGNLTQRPL